MSDVTKNYFAVQKRLLHAAEEFGLPPQPAAKLIVVTKNRPMEQILPLIEAGHRDFGENRVQEAESKWPALKEKYPNIVLHIIGPLQTNKTKEALAMCDVLHTVDRDSLLASITKHKQPHHQFFVQVNTGNEPQKAGAEPLEADAFIEKAKQALVVTCNHQVDDCVPRHEAHGAVAPNHFTSDKSRNGIKSQLVGLMCIPPYQENPAPHFGLLKLFAKRHGLNALSMGMSGDYALAAAMGASYVRVGSAIFEGYG